MYCGNPKWSGNLYKKQSSVANQMFYYIRCITPKRVTSWRGPIFASLHPGNTALFEEMSQRWRAVGNTRSDLTGPRFEPQAFCSRDERDSRSNIWPTKAALRSQQYCCCKSRLLFLVCNCRYCRAMKCSVFREKLKKAFFSSAVDS